MEERERENADVFLEVKKGMRFTCLACLSLYFTLPAITTPHIQSLITWWWWNWCFEECFIFDFLPFFSLSLSYYFL
jgi:hypothetical protein